MSPSCWARTAQRIPHNEEVARELSPKLSKSESVRGTLREQRIATVRQVPGAWVGDLKRFLAGAAAS